MWGAHKVTQSHEAMVNRKYGWAAIDEHKPAIWQIGKGKEITTSINNGDNQIEGKSKTRHQRKLAK